HPHCYNSTSPLFCAPTLPPTSTLFPYTTLFRSTKAVPSVGCPAKGNSSSGVKMRTLTPRFCSSARARGKMKVVSESRISRASARSEEHTSELQSLAYLVCRLLLEKKKMISSHSR